MIALYFTFNLTTNIKALDYKLSLLSENSFVLSFERCLGKWETKYNIFQEIIIVIQVGSTGYENAQIS